VLEAQMHIGWNQAHATGIEEIDAMQEELFRRAAHLVEAARSRKAAEARAHVARLNELARLLFESEEQLLREAGSLSLERHAREHQRFLADLALVSSELARSGPGALSDLGVARHVAAWLDAHVGQTDRDLDLAGLPSARA
jgi:hemerythrin-like metal-binding protein